LEKAKIGRKMMPRYRLGQNAGNKDTKIVGDLHEGKKT
jgi:hypothetical protein